MRVKLPEGFDAARAARTAAAEACAALGAGELSDDVQLVVSELVTNAVLHGEGITELAIDRVDDDGIQVSVHDRNRAMPRLVQAGAENMTGRGLRLVDSVSSRWGADPTGDGKVVWAVVEPGTQADAVEIDADAFLAAWEDDWSDAPSPRHTIELGDVPVRLLLSAKAHVDNLVREFALMAGGAESGVSAAVPPALADLIERVVVGFADARQAIKQQALDAVASGADHVRLTLRLPPEAADAGEAYLAALDEADAWCDAARLLTLETPPQHRVFRTWYVDQLVTQLRSVSAGTPPPPIVTFEDRLLAEIDRVAHSRRIAQRAARSYRVAAALATALDTASVASAVLDEAVPALGAAGGGLLLAADSDVLGLGGAVGYDEDLVARLREESPDAELPAAYALRTGESIWIESRLERDQRFPQLGELEPSTVSLCAVAVALGERRLGALRFSFRDQRVFDADERAFILALAAQCAQALDRAALFDALRRQVGGSPDA